MCVGTVSYFICLKGSGSKMHTNSFHSNAKGSIHLWYLLNYKITEFGDLY